MRAEKRAIEHDKIMMLFSETETAKQNQKIPFHFFFRFAVEGWGEDMGDGEFNEGTQSPR